MKTTLSREVCLLPLEFKGRKRKGITLFLIYVMRWEFFVLFLDDDDDVGATWESDNLFYFSYGGDLDGSRTW